MTEMKRPCLDYLDARRPGIRDKRSSEINISEDVLTSIAWMGDNAPYGIEEACRMTIDKALVWIRGNDQLLGEMVRQDAYHVGMLKRYEELMNRLEVTFQDFEQQAIKENVTGAQVIRACRKYIREA